MPSSVLGTILEMIQLVISNSVSTLERLSGLFGKFLGGLGFVSVAGGPAGIVIAIIVLAIVIYFLGKFVLSTGKVVVLLFLAGLGLALFILMAL